MYDKVLKMLIDTKDSSSHEERQNAFLDLIVADNFQHFEEEQILPIAREAELWVVLCGVAKARVSVFIILVCIRFFV